MGLYIPDSGEGTPDWAALGRETPAPVQSLSSMLGDGVEMSYGPSQADVHFPVQ